MKALILFSPLSLQIFFSFMLTPLFKKPKFASTVGSMLTVVFGCLSLFTVLMNDFPQPLVWLLCLLSPSAFSIGIAQVTNPHILLYRMYLSSHREVFKLLNGQEIYLWIMLAVLLQRCLWRVKSFLHLPNVKHSLLFLLHTFMKASYIWYWISLYTWM